MKNIILCDLDGTLADISHRRHLVEHPAKQCPDCQGKNMKSCVTCADMGWDKFKPNWPAFHAACVHDTPLQTTIDLITYACVGVQALSYSSPEVWIISGRSEEVYKETIQWLFDHKIIFDHLRMRPIGDYTADDKLKRHWLHTIIPKERVFCVFDDRSKVVSMWRAEGLTCYQVAPGDF